LEKDKLEQEIRKLRIENGRTEGGPGLALALAPFVTVIVAVATLGANFFVQSRTLAQERRTLRQQQEDNEEKTQQWQQEYLSQREKDRTEREQESLRRFDEGLARIVTNLGASAPALQVSAAAALTTFLKPRYSDLHVDLLTVIVANLRLGPDPAVGDLLRQDLERAIRLLFDSSRDARAEVGHELDLTDLDLYRIDLSGLDFDGVRVDLAHAILRRANLRDCTLDKALGGWARVEAAVFSGARLVEARFDEAEGEGAQFRECRMISATFKKAKLPRAQFQQALMQSSHFEGANLTGARFEGAQLADAYFTGAILDANARRSIALGAKQWRKARFDPDTRAELERISDGATLPPRPAPPP
jgi:uncharacterized protein YjbI with pentapeptide repeats